MNAVQSALDKTPLFKADAVGTLSVITGVVVGLATVELKSVPVELIVNADTLVTVPPVGVGNVPKVPSPLMYSDAVPLAAISITPLVVTGLLVTVNAAGAVIPILVTVPSV